MSDLSKTNLVRRLGLTLACAALLLGWTTPPAAAVEKAPCNKETEDDNARCEGVCATGDRIGLRINAFDEDEIVEADGSCSTSIAHCDGRDTCSDQSETPAARGDPWGCSFRAHDSWFFPDDGFSYSCWAVSGEVLPQVDVGDLLSPCEDVEPYVADCSGTLKLPEWLEDAIGASTVAKEFADVWEPGARAQRVARVSAAGIVAYSCAGEACVPITPVCDREDGVLRCVV